MGRAPCCDKANVKKGPWSPEEDAKLRQYIEKNGTGGNWIALPQKVGLRRCGKSCRLRWLNYLRPNIKHGEFSDEEDRVIINLFANIGSRWSIIAAQLPGRTDNDIKNYWNTKLKKKLMGLINNNNNNQLRKPNNNTASITDSFSYLLQASPPSSLSYTSHYQQPGSLITTSSNAASFEPNMSPYSSMNNNIPQLPQESLMSHMQQLMVFGHGDQPSSSSSDNGRSDQFEQSVGVCVGTTTNTTSNFHGGIVEEKINTNSNNMVSDGIFKNNVNSWGSSPSSATEDQHHYHSNTNSSVLDYGLEEIKQLICSTNNNSSNATSCGNNFLFDENKTDQERLLYYYY